MSVSLPVGQVSGESYFNLTQKPVLVPDRTFFQALIHDNNYIEDSDNNTYGKDFN